MKLYKDANALFQAMRDITGREGVKSNPFNGKGLRLDVMVMVKGQLHQEFFVEDDRFSLCLYRRRDGQVFVWLQDDWQWHYITSSNVHGQWCLRGLKNAIAKGVSAVLQRQLQLNMTLQVEGFSFYLKHDWCPMFFDRNALTRVNSIEESA